ncbi:MAG: iron-sulfur cluster assembly scaffold protein [Acidobacteria bacterium]|nr:iron-sulfur cluster assembly scaffold protein [Acidobacteriota bacterium]
MILKGKSSGERAEAGTEEKFSRTVLELARHPKNMGKVEDADGFATVTGPCGDTMSMWLKVEEGVIVGAGFTTDGCTSSIASASMATMMAKGRRIDEAPRVRPEEILDALGGLPEENRHCALLAVNTLAASVRDCRERRRKRDGMETAG